MLKRDSGGVSGCYELEVEQCRERGIQMEWRAQERRNRQIDRGCIYLEENQTGGVTEGEEDDRRSPVRKKGSVGR